MVFAIFVNVLFAKKLPLIEALLLILHIVGVFAISIPLLAKGANNSGHDALLVFTNSGNWSTTGTAVMIGLLTPLGSMMGFDCMVSYICAAVHFFAFVLGSPRTISWGIAKWEDALKMFESCFRVLRHNSLGAHGGRSPRRFENSSEGSALECLFERSPRLLRHLYAVLHYQ